MSSDEQAETTHGMTATFARVPRGSSIVVFGHGLLQTFAVPVAGGSVRLGRGADNDVRIAHPSMSRHHAVIHFGATACIEDLASRNGTRLHSVKLPPHVRVPIGAGDVASLGSVLVMIRGGLGGEDALSRVLSASFLERKLSELARRSPAPPVTLVAVVADEHAPNDVVEAAVIEQTRVDELVAVVRPNQIALAIIDGAVGRASELLAALDESFERLGIDARTAELLPASDLTALEALDLVIERANARARAPSKRDRRAELVARVNFVVALYAQERAEDARAQGARVLAAIAELEDAALATMCLVLLGISAHETVGPSDALTYYEAALARSEREHAASRALVLGCIGCVKDQLGDRAASRRFWEEARVAGRGDPVLEVVARAHVAMLDAWAGDVDAARAELRAAGETFATIEEPRGAQCSLVAIGGLVELAAGRLAEAAEHLARARTLEAAGGATQLVFDRLAVAVLDARLRERRATIPTIEIDGARRTVKTPTGLVVELERRKPLWAIVETLSSRHRGLAVSRAELLEAAWPGEKIHPIAAGNRLNVAIATLRRLGLRDVLVSEEAGYALDPRAALRLV